MRLKPKPWLADFDPRMSAALAGKGSDLRCQVSNL